MPFRASCVMEERLRFVAECLAGERSMTVLCGAYGVSRETGYKWLARYREQGPAGLIERSRAPHRPGNGTPESMVEAILVLRRARPHWGPKKLKAWLERERPGAGWPAASTMGDLLQRAGLVESRQRRRPVGKPAPVPAAEAAAPNERWGIDFKGWFRTRDGARCDPLTVTDAMSRYILELRAVPPTTAGVEPAVDRLFREHGLPERLRMDNGPPFASTGAGGLSRLSVRWAKLGIILERITPGCPQENGRHERMHRTLKAETSRPPALPIAEQQMRFAAFRDDFNRNRPHEALGQAVPASLWRPSPRPFPGRLDEPWYDADHQVRRVRPTGEIKWQGELVFVSEALAGEPIGIVELASGDWLLRFCTIELGLLDHRNRRFHRFSAARPGGGQAGQNGNIVNHVAGP
jgi:putative transposase